MADEINVCELCKSNAQKSNDAFYGFLVCKPCGDALRVAEKKKWRDKVCDSCKKKIMGGKK
jgi:hypothetical protein